MKSVSMPTTAGTMKAAFVANCGPCVKPKNSRLNKPVEGRPLINPPTFGPYLSAVIVAKITQAPPMINERSNLNKNVMSILWIITSSNPVVG